MDANEREELFRNMNEMADKNPYLGLGTFKDTGRQSSGAGEALDSVIGAPARVAVQEAQNGNLSWDAVKKIFRQIGADPRTAPTGYDIASRVTDDPYLGTFLATAVDFGAQMPGFPHITPGVIGEVRGVKSMGNVANAIEAFAERGKKAPSLETKIAQMHGEAGEVRDAMPDLTARAEADWGAAQRTGKPISKMGGEKSAYDNPKNAPPKPTEKLPEDYAREEHEKPEAEPSAEDRWTQRTTPNETKKTLIDTTDNPDWNQYVRNLDDTNAEHVQNILNRNPDNRTAEALMAGQEYNHLPYVGSKHTGIETAIPLPNFMAAPTGVIGEPGIQGISKEAADPFAWMDSKYGAAKQLLQRHQSIGMPAEIHTSSDLIGRDDYIDKIPKDSKVNFYFGPDDPSTHRIENPGTPSNKRIESAAQKLEENGIEVNRVYPEGDNYVPIGKRDPGYAHGGVVGMAHGGFAPMTSTPHHMPMPSQGEWNQMTQPPPGFTLDDQSQGAAGSGDLPPGFQLDEDKYGGMGGMAASAGLGLASGATLGLSNVLLTKSGMMKPSTLEGYQRENPGSSLTGELASVLLPGGAAEMIGKAGKATYTGIKALNAVKEASQLGKISKGLIDIGSHAAGSAVEGALYSGVQDTMNDMALGDPNLNGEKIMSHFGQGGLYGGLFGTVLKTAAVGAPPALKAGAEGLTAVKNALIGAGHGEESLVSKALDAADSSGKLSDQFMNRAKNMDVDQQAVLVRDLTGGLNTVKNNFETAQKDLNATLRPIERDALIETANLPKIKSAGQDVINKIKSMQEEVKLNPAKYSGSTLKDLEDARLQIANNLEDQSKGGRFDLFKDLKQTIQDWGQGAAPTLEVLNTKQLFRGLTSHIGEMLTNPDIFGMAGAAEGAHNELLSKIYSFIGPRGKAISASQKEFKKLFLGSDMNFDAKKVKSMLAKYGPEGDRARELLDSWFELQKTLPEHFENTYANVPNDLWDKSKLEGIINNVEKTHGDLGLAQTQYEEALKSQKGRKMGLRELMLGSIGVAHPLLGAVGLGVDMAQRPIEYINKLAEVERVLGKASAGIEKAAKAAFTPALKAIGKEKNPLIRNMLPTQEEHQKVQDHLNQSNNNPAYMTEKLHAATEHLSDPAPNITASLQQSMITASQFLGSKMPSQGSGSPFEKPPEPSPTELAQFERYKEIVDDPVKALTQMKHGLLVPETIETLNAVYPKLYEEMKQAVMKEAAAMMQRKDPIPYSVRQQASFFVGQPIDQAMSPMAIQANQQTHVMAAQQNQSPGPAKGNKGGMAKMTLAKRTGIPNGQMET